MHKWSTQLFEIVNGRQSQLTEPYTCCPFKSCQKGQHTISSRVCCKLRVVFKVVMWSNGSFRPSYELSYGRLNLGGKGHFKTLVMKEESVVFTIPSRFLVIFSFIALFSSSIFFLLFLRRSSFVLLECFVLFVPSFLWLILSFGLHLDLCCARSSLVKGDLLFVAIVVSFPDFAWSVLSH